MHLLRAAAHFRRIAAIRGNDIDNLTIAADRKVSANRLQVLEPASRRCVNRRLPAQRDRRPVPQGEPRAARGSMRVALVTHPQYAEHRIEPLARPQTSGPTRSSLTDLWHRRLARPRMATHARQATSRGRPFVSPQAGCGCLAARASTTTSGLSAVARSPEEEARYPVPYGAHLSADAPKRRCCATSRARTRSEGSARS